MFPETWRRRWGLQEAPFLHDDADRDPLLDRVDRWAVHGAFERLHRGPEAGPSALVFGLRGSGKSALRRRIGEAKRGPFGPLVVELTELDPWLEELGRRRGPDHLPTETDALDLLLSSAAWVLTPELARDPRRLRALGRRQRARLLALLAVMTPDHDGQRARHLGRLLAGRRAKALRVVAGSLGALTALSPLAILQGLLPGVGLEPWVLAAAGGATLGSTALLPLALRRLVRGRARRTATEVGVVAADQRLVARAFAALLPGSLGRGGDPVALRLGWLRELVGSLRAMGWSGLQLLVDRVDESRALDGDPRRMRALLQPLVTGRASEQDGVGVQAFLPVELRPMARPRQVSRLLHSDFEKRGQVEELRWSGQQLLDLVDRRLAAAARGPAPRAVDLVGATIHPTELRDTLDVLGTPRLAFGFLRELLDAHLERLPSQLEATSPAWAVERGTYERCRAAWSDRAATLRRGRVLERSR